MVRRALTCVAVTAAAAAFTACGHKQAVNVTPEPIPANTLTQAEQRSGWMLLFDGRSLSGWHTYQKDLGITDGWAVDDSAITRTATVGDLVSDLQFGSFELMLEWKVAPGSNSGIFFWGNEGTEYVYHNAPEMQVLDNAGHPDGKSPLTRAGALYGLYPAPDSITKPVGEWNLVRIVVHGSKAQFYLNGVKTVDVDFDSKEMKEKIKASKFNEWVTFGKSRRGHIVLQEHGGPVWFRNIMIKEYM